MSALEDDLAINRTAQLQLLEACRAVNPGIAIVHAGTRQIYGYWRAGRLASHHAPATTT
jgi:UDP-glucose 4-epimerase